MGRAVGMDRGKAWTGEREGHEERCQYDGKQETVKVARQGLRTTGHLTPPERPVRPGGAKPLFGKDCRHSGGAANIR